MIWWCGFVLTPKTSRKAKLRDLQAVPYMTHANAKKHTLPPPQCSPPPPPPPNQNMKIRPCNHVTLFWSHDDTGYLVKYTDQN